MNIKSKKFDFNKRSHKSSRNGLGSTSQSRMFSEVNDSR